MKFLPKHGSCRCSEAGNSMIEYLLLAVFLTLIALPAQEKLFEAGGKKMCLAGLTMEQPSNSNHYLNSADLKAPEQQFDGMGMPELPGDSVPDGEPGGEGEGFSSDQRDREHCVQLADQYFASNESEGLNGFGGDGGGTVVP